MQPLQHCQVYAALRQPNWNERQSGCARSQQRAHDSTLRNILMRLQLLELKSPSRTA